MLHKLRGITAFDRRWSTSFRYPQVARQAGTLEAVSMSAKDGTLDCLVQARVRLGDSLLFPALTDPGNDVALRFGERVLSYRELRDAAAAVAERVAESQRVAVWATNEPEVAVAVVGALLAGVPIALVNPKAGSRELAHILGDADPELLLASPGAELPAEAAGRERVDVDLAARGGTLPPEPPDEAPALVVYTSGTTGPPKGAVLPRRSLASNLDALATAWEWTGDDVVAHGLPLFHVHGLVLGTLGPLRRGGATHHLGRFSGAAAAAALEGGATMLFAVPTMYHRLAAEAAESPDVARGAGAARGCSSPARPRSRPSSTSASSASAASGSSSATG